MPKKSRENIADRQYNVAAAMAQQHGFVLRRIRDWHYRLHWPTGECMNVYPVQRRMEADTRPRPPFLSIRPETRDYLIAVVQAAVRTAQRSTV